MCRAHGIPHQNVRRLEELGSALHSAWGLRRHSVVEVHTPKEGNVDLHRQLQDSVGAAVRRTLACFIPTPTMPGAPVGLALSYVCNVFVILKISLLSSMWMAVLLLTGMSELQAQSKPVLCPHTCRLQFVFESWQLLSWKMSWIGSQPSAWHVSNSK